MITFDTGVLVALERRDKRMWDRFRRLRERGVPVLVPASCESEWWRRSVGHAAVRLAILSSVAPLTDAIACAAGEALAALDRRIAKNVTSNVVAKGAMVFQPSDERRRSGSHYTPRSLTEPIVRTTLKPILEQLASSPRPGAPGTGVGGEGPTPALT